jgi:hypothetical protein
MFAKAKIGASDPETQWGLGVGRVVEVDYEEFLITLQILVGGSGDSERVPIPLSFPGAGARHMFGALPQAGDYCVVGWMPQESSNPRNRTPVILNWIVPGVWPGREWMTTANFTNDEMDFGSEYQHDVVGGVLPRIRHKLRHMQPGSILASSSQGSDLVLDESVQLSNRRGNEFILRDQDQAAVLRALQRFDALAGTRIYSGMVQRDATFLATQMFSDGRVWDGKQVVLNGVPLSEGDLERTGQESPEGFLTPARPFGRDFDEDGNPGKTGLQFSENIDPFLFLIRGGFIDASGMAEDDLHQADAIYGGKPVYRVAAQSRKNAVLDPSIPTLTEHRLEITHTSDGRLPVTEQTDMFDADRLPDSGFEAPGGSDNAPFIEWVMGSVIGNDPFSPRGRLAYGRPLVPKIFDGDAPNPRLEPVGLAAEEGRGASPEPLENHAATLFKLNPLDNGRPTFWSVNKKGQFRGFIGGPLKENSVELALAGGLKLKVAGALQLMLDGGLSLGTKSRGSFNLVSEKGPVTIFGGGSSDGPESRGEKNDNLPAVDIVARTNMRLKATKKVFVKGAAIDVEATTTRIKGHDLIELATAKKIRTTAETLELVVTAKATEEYSGPKGFRLTNAPLHSQTYTPSAPGIVAKRVNFTFGDREERFNLGNHTTTILIGDQTYESLVGTVTLKGTTSTVEVGPTGITGTALVGNVSLSAPAGTASMTALAGVYISADAGVAIVRGALGVALSGPIYGGELGPILCAGTREPFTNLPYLTWGLGAKGHLITPG